jgi:ADP-dependent NAD(P)H-hydrate dehydratase / NAD(P)H-hydrate epimerase
VISGGIQEFLEAGVVSAERMRAIEQNAIALGLDSPRMMESAGRALAEAALSFQPENVLVLCGRGNNGGDGMVAARYLRRLPGIDLIYPGDGPISPEAACQLELLRHSAVPLHPVRCPADVAALQHLFTGADVIVDAMLGTGASGVPREPLRTCVRLANESRAKLVAADIPTPGVRADRICSFHRPKLEGAEVIDIGIPLEAECFVGPGDLTMVPVKNPESHKGAGGKVLVVGGGPYQGAPYLAGLAALRAGADIVRIASPVALPQPDLIYERIEGAYIAEEHIEQILRLAGRSDVVVCGNGIGEESHAVVQAVSEGARRVVFDADALRMPLPAAEETIYTPHAGEFVRMTGTELPAELVSRARTVRDAAERGVVLLKGAVDIISDGQQVRFNRTGTPAMSVGGTGDVLAGVCGALFCRMPAFDAACIAAYVNGRAGMAADKRLGDGMLASDLIECIPGELFRRSV